MKAALAGRQDPRLVVAGRTGAPSDHRPGGYGRRARCTRQAGIDALFIVGLKSRADLAAVSAATTLPLILGNVGGDLASADLAAHRVRISLQGHAPIMAAVQAVYDTMKALREGTKPGELKNVAPNALMNTLTRAAAYDEATKSYL